MRCMFGLREVKQDSGPTEWQEAHCQVIEVIKVEEGGGIENRAGDK